MEHICFEVQLCSEILIFKEKSNFWYTDHPEKSALILQSDKFDSRQPNLNSLADNFLGFHNRFWW